MIQNIEAANAARLDSIDAKSADMRRLTASSRSGQSFVNNETLTVAAKLLPSIAAIDGGGEYLAYDTVDGRQLSYKTLFGKKVVAPADVEAKETSYSVEVNGTSVPVVLIDREHFGPRTVGNLSVAKVPLKDGSLIEQFTTDQQLTVHVQDMYVVRRPDAVERHPAGQYYAYLAANYATFQA